jgi:5-methylthioadenosine/S-adenosylhomocysteine deaminase
LGSVKALSKVIALASDTTYVHCRRFSRDEFNMIADSGGTVSLCCALDTFQARGIPPFQDVLECGLRPSLSVDEEMDAPNDMFTQMRLALALQRGLIGAKKPSEDVSELSAPLLSARDVMEFATIEGARANGLEKKAGSLTPGKEADLILLRKDRINVLPMNDAEGAVVLAMDTSNVDSVFIAGKPKKLHGELIDVDLKKIASEAQRSREYLLDKGKVREALATVRP